MKRLTKNRIRSTDGAVLSELRKKLTAADSDKLRRCLDYVLESERLKNAVVGLQQNPEALEAVCARSYLHANGFYKITLWDSPEFKLRLHCRDVVSAPEAMEHVHSHRWAFASYIFSGGYRMQLFVEADSGKYYQKHRYLRLDANKYRVEYLGKVRLAVETEATLCAGSSYVMLPATLHNLTFKEKKPFFSLVLTAPAQRPDCLLYSRNAYNSNPIVCQSLDFNLVQERLNLFLSLL